MNRLKSTTTDALLASLYIFLHIAFFSTGTVLVKAVSISVGIAQLIFARSLATLVPVLITRTARQAVMASMRTDVRNVLALRAITGFLGIYGVYYTVANLPVSVALTITGITPIFVIFLERLILKQAIRPEIYAYAVLAAIGIYLTAKNSPLTPSPNVISMPNIAIGLISGVLVAVSFVSVRHAAQKVGTSAIMFWFGLGKLAGATLLGGATLLTTSYSLRDASCIAAICLLGAASDFSKTSAYRLSPAWIVSLLSLLAIPTSGIMANILFGERLSPTQLAGIGLMLVALSIAMCRRNQFQDPR